MSSTDTISELRTQPISLLRRNASESGDNKLLLSIIVPAFNEAAILEKNLTSLCEYLDHWLAEEYRWEMILVNDGSHDRTGELAESFACTRPNVHVLHHPRNFGMGQALITAFNYCRGDYVVTMDIDLSYSPLHIRQLMAKIRETRAKIVVASPYMKDGSVTHVPWLRRILSAGANYFLSTAGPTHLSTLTGLVRAYDGEFLRQLDLRSMGMEINLEILYKAWIMNGRIEEIPAHLDWESQLSKKVERKSSMNHWRQAMSVLRSYVIFRPTLVFTFPAVLLLLFSLLLTVWVSIRSFVNPYSSTRPGSLLERFDAAIIYANEHFFGALVMGGGALVLAILLLCLAIVSWQNKNYFEQTFHLLTTTYRCVLDTERKNTKS